MKRGALLVGTVVFLLFTLAFLSVLSVFVIRQSSSTAGFEESYAKQIALLLDAARPGMELTLDMGDAKDASGEWFREHYIDAVTIENNLVRVQLSDDSSYSYSFFSDVSVGVDMFPEGKLVMVVGSHE